MTRKDLESYKDLSDRLKALRLISKDLSFNNIKDLKSDSQSREIENLSRRKSEIDKFIENIGDYRAKNLIDLHYRRGYSWAKVAAITEKSMDANKKFMDRFIIKEQANFESAN